MWKSEWTMLSVTWSEFEGVTVYLNGRKLLCQQTYDYYAVKGEAVDVLLGGKAFSFESNLEREAVFEKLRKRSRDSAALAGLIHVGLNNNVNKLGRKFFWSYRDEASSAQQNVLLASTFSEAVLLDELAIINFRMNSKDIVQMYLRGL